MVVSRVSNRRSLAGMPAPVRALSRVDLPGVGIAYQGDDRDRSFSSGAPAGPPGSWRTSASSACSRWMRSRMWRRSVSSFVSPGPRVPMPPPRRDRLLPMPAEPGQQILVLGQLHLQAALRRSWPAGQKYLGSGRCGPAQLRRSAPPVPGSARAKGHCQRSASPRRCAAASARTSWALPSPMKLCGSGVWRFCSTSANALASGSLQKRRQLVERRLRRCLFRGKAIGIEAHQNCPLYHMSFQLFHIFLPWQIEKSPHRHQARACAHYFRPYFLLKRSTRPPVSTSFCLPV